MTPDKIEKLCLKARQAIEQRDWEKAKQAYLMALGLRSDLPDVHYGLATVYYQLRELTSAAHHFREVTRLDPLRAGAYVNLGAVLNLLNQYDEAITALRRGIQLDGQRTEGYYNLGLVYRRKGQPDLAIQAYREALRLNPRMADAHHNLANLYFDKNQHRLALQHWEMALQIRPNWDKALEGMDRARAALSGEEHVAEGAAPKTAPVGNALDHAVDPAAHQDLLLTLYRTSKECEEFGRNLQKILGEEIDPAIKELSTCLLYPNGPRSELDACIQKFDAALQHMHTTRQNLQKSMGRLEELEDLFPAP
jgi:tetratricopeptide (TPR) repeat protein